MPGKIEAEDFDPAGYFDTSSNNEGSIYRTNTDVDIKAITGGFAIGWTVAGEWLEYTINVVKEGDVAVTIRSGAVAPGRSLQILQCDKVLLNNFAVPQVAAWGEFKTWPAGTIHLTPGVQKIRIKIGAVDNIDLDWIYLGPYTGQLDPPLDPSPVTCNLPGKFSWTSSAPLISAKNAGWASIKDPSIVKYNGVYHVFASIFDTVANGYSSVYLNFTDFNQAAAAPQTLMRNLTIGSTVAPQVFYFRPQNKWYLITQWGGSYSTNTDISNINGWTRKQPLLAGEPADALDFWTICDDANCYLFFSRDDGNLYMSKTTLANFPKFSGYTTVMTAASPSLLFEASNVYKIEGTDKYLLMVEAYDTGPRFFRSWTATNLNGPWTALADSEQNPLAGNNNVQWPTGKWADGISHGEMIRSGFDERLTVDPCNLQFLYQGKAGNSSDYNTIPYKLGLITLKK